jgi:hypothetical protein
MENINKVYIPESYEKTLDGRRVRQKLWAADQAGDEEAIVEYIREAGMSEPEKALRFTWVQGREWYLQMVIPTTVVDGHGLEEWAECYKSRNKLMKFLDGSNDAIDWEAWGIKGYQEQPDI